MITFIGLNIIMAFIFICFLAIAQIILMLKQGAAVYARALKWEEGGINENNIMFTGIILYYFFFI